MTAVTKKRLLNLIFHSLRHFLSIYQQSTYLQHVDMAQMLIIRNCRSVIINLVDVVITLVDV
jgi:hypothetical protein